MPGPGFLQDITARFRGSGSDPAAGPPRHLPLVGLTVLVVGIAGLAAFFQLFTSFAPYDDEGYLLISLREFLEGGALYDDVYTQYGPAYYLLFGGAFRLFGIAPSTDVGRSITLVVWVSTPLLMGAAAWLGTRRLSVTAITALAGFGALSLLIAEPMHPVGLSTLLTAAVTLAVVGAGTRPRVSWPLLGVLLGLLALTKINLGAFAMLAVVFALVVSAQRSGTPSRTARAAAGLLLLAPLLLLLPDLTTRGSYNLILLTWAGLFCLAAVTVDVGPTPTARPIALGTAATAGLGALIATVVVTLGVTIALGSSVRGLVDGLVVQPSKLRDVFQLPLTVPDAAAWWAAGAVLAAILVRRRPDVRLPAGPAGAAIRATAAAAILLSAAQISPLSLGPASGPLPLGALLVWLVLVPPAHVERQPAVMFVRSALVALSLIEMLQVYPVAGTQVRAAALLFVVPAAFLLSDGLSELERWTAGRPDLGSARSLGTSATVAVTGALVLVVTVQPLITFSNAWSDGRSVDTAGSSVLRLPPDRADGYMELARTVRNECRALITLPGFNSLHIWSGVKPPTGLNAGAWMTLLDTEQQQRVVDALAGEPRTCLVRNQKQLEAWLQGRPLPDRPLARFVTTRFDNPRSFLGGEYELLTRIAPRKR